MLFGPQAGRKGGVAPALLTYSPASHLGVFSSHISLFVRELGWSGVENRPERVVENRLQDGSLRNCEFARCFVFGTSDMTRENRKENRFQRGFPPRGWELCCREVPSAPTR
jgi:hypothetical protein